MNAIPFDQLKAKEVEAIVCETFGCRIADIVCYSDTVFKKVVVYVLSKFYAYDRRSIGHAYQMTYLYVPTVVEEMEVQMRLLTGFRDKIVEVLKRVEYETNVGFGIGKTA